MNKYATKNKKQEFPKPLFFPTFPRDSAFNILLFYKYPLYLLHLPMHIPLISENSYDNIKIILYS